MAQIQELPANGCTGSIKGVRPRPIMVRLVRCSLRDELLWAARVRRGVDTSGIIDGELRRYYFNEHLTPLNRYLFFKARGDGNRKGWRYVWTRGGKIYVRRSTDIPVYRVRAETDMYSKVFLHKQKLDGSLLNVNFEYSNVIIKYFTLCYYCPYLFILENPD